MTLNMTVFLIINSRRDSPVRGQIYLLKIASPDRGGGIMAIFGYFFKFESVQKVIDYYIVILRWPVGSRMLHQNTTVIRRVTTVRTERGVRLMVCQGDVS